MVRGTAHTGTIQCRKNCPMDFLYLPIATLPAQNKNEWKSGPSLTIWKQSSIFMCALLLGKLSLQTQSPTSCLHDKQLRLQTFPGYTSLASEQSLSHRQKSSWQGVLGGSSHLVSGYIVQLYKLTLLRGSDSTNHAYHCIHLLNGMILQPMPGCICQEKARPQHPTRKWR